MKHYTDRARCVRVVTIETDASGVRIERDVLTRQGRKEWARKVEAIRTRCAATRDGER